MRAPGARSQCTLCTQPHTAPHPRSHKEITQHAVGTLPAGMFRSGVFCPKVGAVVMDMNAAGRASVVEAKPRGEPVPRLRGSPGSDT